MRRFFQNDKSLRAWSRPPAVISQPPFYLFTFYLLNSPALLQKLQSLPGLTDDERAALTAMLATKKKYGLIWEDKPEAVEEQLRTMLPVLEEVAERRVVGGWKLEVGSEETGAGGNRLFPDSTSNLQLPTSNLQPPTSNIIPDHTLIEGDNLHALTALSFTHEGRIDVIYIDPPYNTGNNDFKYNDSFVDREDSYRHSKWLSFMHKRLLIARRLLADTGVIFISIDDNEQAQLKLLCDEVFGEGNEIETYIWESTFRPDNSSKILRKNAEFVYCYAKLKENVKEFKGLEYTRTGLPSLTKATMPVGILSFKKEDVDFLLKDGDYDAGAKGEYELLDNVTVLGGKAVADFRLKGRMIWGQDYLDEETKRGTRIIIKTKGFIPYTKKPEEGIIRPPKLIPNEIVGDVLAANAELDALFGKRPIRYPKPSSLIKYLLNFSLEKNTSILDFFAGSGTTLHATMALNAEDGGSRQCILVTNNENNICEEVTYERNKRVIQGYVNSKGAAVPGLTNNSLRYYKTAFVPAEKTEANRRRLTALSTELLQIKEGCYEPVAVPGLKPAEGRVFSGSGGRCMAVIYHSRAQEAAVAAIIAWVLESQKVKGKSQKGEGEGEKGKGKSQKEGPGTVQREASDAKPPTAQPSNAEGIQREASNLVRLYAFSPDGDALAEDFWEVRDRVEAVPLPDAIYNAYRATFRSIGIGR